VSRLLEIQSESYFAASTLRYPVEAGGALWLHRELLRLEDPATGTYETLLDIDLMVHSNFYFSIVCSVITLCDARSSTCFIAYDVIEIFCRRL
jgi:hypothetical protein